MFEEQGVGFPEVDEEDDREKDLRIEVKLKNNILWQAIHRQAKSVFAFCGRNHSVAIKVGALLNLKQSPFKPASARRGISEGSEYRQICLDLAKRLNLPPEYLFPTELYEKFVGQKTFEAVAVSSFSALPNFSEKVILAFPAPEEAGISNLELEELRGNLGRVLKGIPSNWRNIIELHHGLRDGVEHTFTEISEILGCTVQNVGAMYHRGMNRLRNPLNSGKLEGSL